MLTDERIRDEPRVAATLLLTRDEPFEVLMVTRNARGSFPSALVFPGGAVDDDDRSPEWLPLLDDPTRFDADERARRIAAVRETWEESGVLVASRGAAARGDPAATTSGDPAATGSGNPHVAANGSPAATASTDAELNAERSGPGFRELVRQRGITLTIGDLVPFAHWITPTNEPRRFDAYFYLAAAPANSLAVADGRETTSVRWLELADAARAATEVVIRFPTLMNLNRLAESRDTRSALAAAASRELVTVAPVIDIEPDGTRVVRIPSSAGYGLTEYREPKTV